MRAETRAGNEPRGGPRLVEPRRTHSGGEESNVKPEFIANDASSMPIYSIEENGRMDFPAEVGLCILDSIIGVSDLE